MSARRRRSGWVWFDRMQDAPPLRVVHLDDLTNVVDFASERARRRGPMVEQLALWPEPAA